MKQRDERFITNINVAAHDADNVRLGLLLKAFYWSFYY